MRTKLLSFLMLLTVAVNYGQITATSLEELQFKELQEIIIIPQGLAKI